MIQWATGGLFAWIGGQWWMRSVDVTDPLYSLASLMSTLGLVTMAACIFWAVRLTLPRDRVDA